MPVYVGIYFRVLLLVLLDRDWETIKQMYALFDKQTNTYLNPLHFINHGDAVRWLTSVVNQDQGDQKSNVSLYPQQFILVHTGNYDDQTGKTENISEEIMQANSVKETVKRYTIEQFINELNKQSPAKDLDQNYGGSN